MTTMKKKEILNMYSKTEVQIGKLDSVKHINLIFLMIKKLVSIDLTEMLKFIWSIEYDDRFKYI